MTLTTAASRFIEQLGLLLGAEGYSRIAGRLFGLLLVTENAASLDDLAGTLGVTKASVSTNIRWLEARGVVERESRPGDRRDYYRIAPDILVRTLEHRLTRIQRFQEAVAGARATVSEGNPVIRGRLDHLVRAYQKIHQLTSRALDEWRAR